MNQISEGFSGQLRGFAMISSKSKKVVTRILVSLGLFGVAISYFATYVLVAYIAAGIAWYASLALLVSGPTSAIGGAFAVRKPRQKIALTLGIMGFALWVALWILYFTVLGFKLGPST